MSSGDSTPTTPRTPSETAYLPEVGSVVEINGVIGKVHYAGTTSFATGLWVGIELEAPKGKNDGSVQGIRYFTCEMGYGVFVRPSQVRRPDGTPKPAGTPTSSTPSARSRPTSAPPSRSTTPTARNISQRTSTRPSPSPSTVSRPTSAPLGTARTGSARNSTVGPTRVLSPTSGLPSPKLRNSAISPVPRGASPPNPLSRGSSRSTSRSGSFSDPQEELEKKMHMSTPKSALKRISSELREEEALHTEEVEEVPAPPVSVTSQVSRLVTALEPPRPSDQVSSATTNTTARPASALDFEQDEQIIQDEHIAQVTDVTPPLNTTYDHPVVASSITNVNASPSKFSQLVPLRDLEDLRIKIKHLEIKRAEDREKLLEFERLRTELDSAVVMRSKLSEKLQELQAEMKDARRQLKDALEEKDHLEVQLAETQEGMEMILLDKEMAEERADSLQAEVHALEEKVEELSLDLEVLKEEGHPGAPADDEANTGESEERSSVAFIQLERQNERLKDALVKLRDVTTEQEAVLKDKIEMLEKEAIELAEYKVQHEKVSEKLAVAEVTIEDLKAMIDDSLGAEDMVETLTERNMILNEKLEEAKAVIQDLEALKELNDELEQDHIETEKLLQEEIDLKDGLLVEQGKRISGQEEALADYERTIVQFRDLVRTLQSDLDRLRRGVDDGAPDQKQRDLGSQTQAMVNLNLQLQSTALKAQARAVELELRKLDVEQAMQQLEMIKPYLPDSFFQTEVDALFCILLFRRLYFKAHLLAERVKEVANQTDDPGEADKRSFLWHIVDKLGQLDGLARQFDGYMGGCSVDQFMKLGKMYPELTGAEKKLDHLIELVKNEEIKGIALLNDLTKSIMRLERLAEAYLRQGDGPIDVRSRQHLMQACIAAVGVSTERVGADVERVDVALTGNEVDDNVVDETLPASRGEVLTLWEDVRKVNASVKATSKKLERRLDDMARQGWTVRASATTLILDVNTQRLRLTDFCDALASEVVKHIQECRKTNRPVVPLTLHKASRDAAERIFGTTEGIFGTALLENLQKLVDSLGQAETALGDDGNWEKIPSTSAPWLSRADRVKSDYTVNSNLQKQVESLNEEVMTLVREVKSKDQLLQESAVKIELLEKRMENVRKHAETISHLEDSLTKTKEKAKVYEEAVESLHADLEQLENENEKLRKVVKRYERQQPGVPGVVSPRSMRIDSTSDAGAGARGRSEDVMRPEGVESVMDDSLLAQFESLKSAVRFLRTENSRLKADKAMASSVTLFDPLDPLMRRGLRRSDILSPAAQTADADSPEERESVRSPSVEDGLAQVRQEARKFARQVSLIATTPRVVDVTRMPAATERKWWSCRDDPRIQKLAEEEKGRRLWEKGMELREKVHRAVGATSTTLASHGPRSLHQGKAGEMPLLGRVRFPCTLPEESGRRKCVVLKTRKEFEALHAVLAI
ncbi:uncharacterized protein SPPG_02084 [Spizellomyces punctatus DAOM BR117]|uniref:CAP-Gly domain-containing protein n=1 Tax=Spizellomyces punctatus (strain DAOM BR117) TaxID=645134 RepID=A0A0L0HPN1_SPIPD|nr:uncharacterized protein SPPG_02084 [Spizellomyces punctatus DAOM BR117]KND03013.1 hypothetical protein SPPG_02084 [Spizellomyces punctatus DAOM BR117]|eukprot:XP_016611052.1 hypothetical protein SPPG_02084 [Spizellomyces punctatus DAOM BR117]